MHRIRKLAPDGTLTTYAGDDTGVPGSSGDGVTAIGAKLHTPKGLGIDPEDNIYYIDAGTYRARKIDTNGIITTVVGTGSQGNMSQGIVATTASMYDPRDVAIGPRGGIYILDRFSFSTHLLFRVDSDGRYWTHSRENQTLFPTATSITIDPMGNIYVADPVEFRVRKFGHNLTVTDYAGNGQDNNGTNAVVDGGSALGTALRPRSVSFRNGQLYIADRDRVRVITSDGVISTIAGPGDSGVVLENVPGVSSAVDPAGVAVDHEGNVIIADASNNRIRKLSLPLPGYSGQDVMIPSQDGGALYVFDATGRHKETRNTTTAALVFSFAYDAEGHLTSITDGDGDITTIQRDGLGNPTAIVSQDGLTSTLTVNANGYLKPKPYGLRPSRPQGIHTYP